MCVCIRSNTRLRVTTASGMNLFNLIRFEKYGGGIHPCERSRIRIPRSDCCRKTTGGEGRVEDAFKRTFKRSEKKGERETSSSWHGFSRFLGRCQVEEESAVSRTRYPRHSRQRWKGKERKRKRRGIGTARLVEARKESRAKSSLEMPRKQCRGWPEIYLIVESTAGVEGEEREREGEKRR